MSRSGQRKVSSETVIYVTAAPSDNDQPAPASSSRRGRVQSTSSRKTVYKVMQKPAPSPPPELEDDRNEISLSVSLEENSVTTEMSPVVRVVPYGASIVLEQVTQMPRSSSSSRALPPRRKSLPASSPPMRSRARSQSLSRSRSRPLSPAVVKVVQEQSWYDSEPEPEPEPERESDEAEEADIKIKFEIAARSGSDEESRKEPSRKPRKTPDPCLDCLEEFLRRKRAEQQRKGSPDVSSQVEVTVSGRRICSQRSSKSVASSSVPSYRCPKCHKCKSCGSISISMPP
ncbi:hypothetical protein V5799_030722 [Amblyomma americanum]|uniref:Uncharacterized protein n=1 Tax=Amblyomma americanum TaxID=6943 RepID=A0AAQ4EMK9_AMBAM